jgi:hypothetical protein
MVSALVQDSDRESSTSNLNGKGAAWMCPHCSKQAEVEGECINRRPFISETSLLHMQIRGAISPCSSHEGGC